MTLSFFSVGKELIDKNPGFLNFASFLFNALSFNRKRLKGVNNSIDIQGAFLNRCCIEVYGNNNTVCISSKCYLNRCSIKIYGNNCKVNLSDQVCVHYSQLHIEDDGGEISINENTLICGQTHLAVTEGTKITIGKDCLFSSNIVFRTGDSHSILDSNGKRINSAKSINIGNHVWICAQTILLKGSGLANDSVLGTGSILNKSYEETNVIVAGNPAKIVRNAISWDKSRINENNSK